MSDESGAGSCGGTGRTPRGWLLLFCLLVLIWEPFSLALLASSKIGAIADRPLALLVLLVRLLVAGLGVAAGLAVWTGRAAGITLAKTYLILSSVVVLVVSATPYFPTSRPPGMAAPIAAVILSQNVAWFAYLTWSRHVREFR